MGPGISHFVIEEADPRVRIHMLQYQGNLMQDALELNWNTTNRAHAAVLTETERGHVSWSHQVGSDRIHLKLRQPLMQRSKLKSGSALTRIIVTRPGTIQREKYYTNMLATFVTKQ